VSLPADGSLVETGYTLRLTTGRAPR
jgi:hypothetical protein